MVSQLVIKIQPNKSHSFQIYSVNYLNISSIGPDSKDSYNEWIKVRRTIDLTQQKIKLTYQFNPLTWHYYSFKINQGIYLK